MKKIITLFSYLFHPLFIAGYAALYYVNTTKDYFSFSEKALIISQIIVVTLFIPLGIYFVLKQLNRVQSIMMANAQERKIPLAINCMLLLLLIRNNLNFSQTPELYLFFVGCLFSSILALFLSILNFKASLHLIGISTLTCFILILHQKTHVDIALQTLSIVSIGLVWTSRLIMKAHTTKELIVGLLVGVIPQTIVYTCWL